MSFQREITIAERVGIPAATFVLGALILYMSTISQLWILPWVGAFLVLASLTIYVWLAARSTSKVQAMPQPIPTELHEQLVWMKTMVENLVFNPNNSHERLRNVWSKPALETEPDNQSEND